MILLLIFLTVISNRVDVIGGFTDALFLFLCHMWWKQTLTRAVTFSSTWIRPWGFLTLDNIIIKYTLKRFLHLFQQLHSQHHGGDLILCTCTNSEWSSIQLKVFHICMNTAPERNDQWAKLILRATVLSRLFTICPLRWEHWRLCRSV